MVTCTRRLEFDAGHRIVGHESKCAHLHGHRYVVEATAQAELDSLGRVIDFGVLKAKLGTWIDRNWDHGLILFKDDPQLPTFQALETDGGHPQKTYVLNVNPTAENIAQFLLTVVGPSLLVGTGVELVKVRVWETPNCYAEAMK